MTAMSSARVISVAGECPVKPNRCVARSMFKRSSYIISHKVSPKTDPCGTPHVIFLLLTSSARTELDPVHDGHLQIYVLVLSLTLVTSLVVFGALVIRSREYFYNGNGLMACEPFYQRPSLRILAACLFYFPTTMALMYFYGSALHMDRLRHRQRVNICAALVQPMMPNNTVAMVGAGVYNEWASLKTRSWTRKFSSREGGHGW